MLEREKATIVSLSLVIYCTGESLGLSLHLLPVLRAGQICVSLRADSCRSKLGERSAVDIPRVV